MVKFAPALGLGVAAVAAAAISFSAVWPSILVAMAAVTIANLPRRGLGFSIGAGPLAIGAALLVAMIGSAATGLPLTPTVTTVMTMLSLLVAAFAVRAGSRMPSAGALAAVLPAGIAALAVPVLAAAAWALRGASSVSWVMRGDAALFHIVARQVVGDSGIRLGPETNAVPLPTALFALAIDPGRSDLVPSRLLEHDLAGLVLLWSGLISLAALLAGAIVGTVLRRVTSSLPIIAIGSATGALLLTTWMFTGYPVQYGFLNAHVAMVIQFAAVLVAVERRSMASALVALAAASVLFLATWSPLAIVPVGLAVAVAVQDRLTWRTLRARHVVALAVSAAVGIGYVALAVLPGLLAGKGSQLAVDDATAESLPIWLLPLLVAVGVVLALIGGRDGRGRRVGIAVGLGIACLIGLAAVVVAAGLQWSYYPLKMAWLASLPVIVLALANAFSAAATFFASFRRVVVAVGIAGTALALAGGLPGTPGLFDSGDLAARIINGGVMVEGDDVSGVVLAHTDPAQPELLWRSGIPSESMAIFWQLMSTAVPGPDGSALVAAAYDPASYGSVERLCEIAAAAGRGIHVITIDPRLAEQVSAACPLAEMEFLGA